MLYLYVLVLLWACPTAAGRLREFYLEHTNTTINAWEARDICRQRNYTDLVTVYDNRDNKDLAELLLHKNATSAWIGAISNEYLGAQWSDGAEVTFNILRCDHKFWCATMKADGGWECIICKEARNFMCYNEDVEGTSHIYSLISEAKNWTDAQLYCRENHTDLVSIRNEQENQQVHMARGQNTNSFWIGLKLDEILNYKVSWFNGGQSKYRKFSNNLIQATPMFTHLHLDESWSHSNTSENISALCYESLIHVSPDEMSWEDALDYCNKKASGLLRIESKKDQIETEEEIRRCNVSEPVWIGLRQSRLFGFWMWVNGLHVGSWSNWKDGQQPEHQKSHHCGVMEKMDDTFKWSDKDCRYRYRVLCEKR